MAKRWEARAKALPVFLKAADKFVAATTERTAIILSSGPESYAALRKAGYPYAVRNPIWQSFAEIINVHDGSVQGGWRVVVNSYGGNLNTRMRVFNSSPWMVYLLQGTTLMIRRPIDSAIIHMMRPVRLRAYRMAVFHALV
jgi:hypothetical protein